MTKKIITTDKAPKAIGAYSRAVKVGNTVYLSGQIALDPATGEIVNGDIETETCRVLDNLKAVAEASGGSLANVVRFTIYLTNSVRVSGTRFRGCWDGGNIVIEISFNLSFPDEQTSKECDTRVMQQLPSRTVLICAFKRRSVLREGLERTVSMGVNDAPQMSNDRTANHRGTRKTCSALSQRVSYRGAAESDG